MTTLTQAGLTDKQKIRRYLEKNKTITCTEAIHKIGVYNLRSRASEMSDLVSEMVKVTRADGVKTRVAQYRIAKQ